MYTDIFPTTETKCTPGDQTCGTSAYLESHSRCYTNPPPQKPLGKYQKTMLIWL